jgi:hypothetical protein
MPETAVKQDRFVQASKINARQTMVNILYTKPAGTAIDPAPENKPIPDQTDLFHEEGIEEFLHTAMVIVRSITPPFCMSDVVKHLPKPPANPKWLGYPLTNTMRANGYYTTGIFQRSPNPTRKGGTERQWNKGGIHASA